jgi:outer membrane receptor protein involved in Fe transport
MIPGTKYKGDHAMRKKAARSVAKPSRLEPAVLPHLSRSRLALAIAATLSGSAAMHAAPALAAADSSSDSGTLGEIIVTARKRAENLQDVPVSIDVYTSKDLKNLAITQFEDYATMTPSISFVSAGPGTQTFVMRGVSDGSNPNYANTASTAFLLDDMSMNYYGTTPDLHLYDIQQIEVLNGPQGTTYGASAMAGALRFITNKPDPKTFSAGVDVDEGKIQGGTHNSTEEGYINLPLIPDWTALRISAYSDYHGGFINNVNTTRNWVNGTVSNNSQWAGNDYNVERVTGARIALSQVIADGWKASLTYSYQRQLTHGAWDENTTIGGALDYNGNLIDGPLRSFGQDNVDRFGPEYKRYYAKTLDFHLDGDVGIGDLVYASTYWAQNDEWVNEYSEYMQYINTGPPSNLTAPSRQAFACQTDPISSGGTLPFSGCQVPIQFYDYSSNTDRWSNELRLQSKEGGRLHWLAGLYWEKSRELLSNFYHMPGLQVSGAEWQSYAAYYGQTGKPPAPDDWYSYVSRSDYLQTTEFVNATFDITPQWKVEAGTSHFHSEFNSVTYGGFWYSPQSPTQGPGGSSKWDSKVGLSFKANETLLLYADVAQGFRDGGVNPGLPLPCQKNGVPAQYAPDTLTNYEVGFKSTLLDRHMVWDGAVYYMPWKNLQSLIYDPGLCASASFDANIGNARVYGVESNVKYQASSFLTMEVSASYNDARVLTDNYENVSFQVQPGERLPYDPYFSWSGNIRYEAPFRDALHAYIQYDVAHKGDMWNNLQANGSNGLPRVLQPGYSIMNLRLGLSQTDTHWLAELYIANLLDKNAIIYTNEGNFDLRQTVNEPRVFGLRLSYRWGGGAASAEE